MDKVAQRQISGTSYPQSGSPLREDNDRIDGAGMEIDEVSWQYDRYSACLAIGEAHYRIVRSCSGRTQCDSL